MADSADNGPDLTGTKIGEYEIMSRLGLGGMGVVYEGRQPLIGKRVAIKILLPQLSADRELVERFISEARAVNEIGHRGIVDIFSFGVLVTGQHYFVMEYLDGMPFDRLIKQRAPIPCAEALWWIEEVCEALHGAHEAGIIHRDIKPSNLFLVDTGRGRPYVKLLDFGIAKLGAIKGENTPQTRASVVVGTPDYMSPEQARGEAISPRTDVYALGCVLFELLTGKRPFKGDNALQTMFMHVEKPAPKLSDVLPGLPHPLDDLLLWTMEKDPNARPASTDELRAHLEEIRATLPELAPRSSPSRGSGTSSPGMPLVTTPKPTTDPRRSISGSGTPAAAPSGPRPTTGARKAVTGSAPAMSSPPPRSRPSSPSLSKLSAVQPGQQLAAPRVDELLPPVSEPVELSFTGEQQPVVIASEQPTKALPPLAPLAPVAPKLRVPVPDDDDDDDDYQSRGSKAPWVIAFLVLVAVGVYGGMKYLRPKPPVVEETEKPPEPVVETPPVVEAKPPAPVVETPPPVVEEVKPVPVVAKPVKLVKPIRPVKPAVVKQEAGEGDESTRPTPTAANPPPTTKPGKPLKVGAISAESIAARIEKYDAKLAEKERASGNADREMRQMMIQARALAEQADNEVRMKRAWKYLDDIQHQLEAGP